MKVATSILSIKDNLQDKLKILNNTNTDYIHLDIMDGIFVPNKTWDINFVQKILTNVSKPLDVHLMVVDLEQYIMDFLTIKPEYITFHVEATYDISKYINLVKSNGVKVGLSIKPTTDIRALLPYLDLIDLVLIMSVEPGFGGQKFISGSLNKIAELKKIRDTHELNYIIEVDGGINNDTISLVRKAGADMVVSGSFITNDDNYEEKITYLKNN